MSIRILLIIALLLLDIYLGVTAIESVIQFIHAHLLSGLSALFFGVADRVETPAETAPPKTRYDVDSFRTRISELMDDDGLYDIPPEPPQTDGFTGTEIITNEYEKDMYSSIDGRQS